MADARPMLPLIPEDSQSSDITTTVELELNVPGPRRDSDGSLLNRTGSSEDPNVESLPYRDSRRSSGYFGNFRIPDPSRESDVSAYWSARTSNVSSIPPENAPFNGVSLKDPRRSSGYFGDLKTPTPLRDSQASSYWSARGSVTSSEYTSVRGSNMTDLERLSSMSGERY